MLAPELIRLQEKPQANWVTPAKVNAIRGEFMRQCDGLGTLADGIINNYMASHAIFDVTQGAGVRTQAVGGEAMFEQCRSRSGRHERERLPHRWSDLDVGVHLFGVIPLPRRSRMARGRSACRCRIPIRRAAV